MFTIGVDFGTNSARAIVVSCGDGKTVGTGVSDYHSGDHGVLTHPSDPHLARQNPADYIGSLGHAISAALGLELTAIAEPNAKPSPASGGRGGGRGAIATMTAPVPGQTFGVNVRVAKCERSSKVVSDKKEFAFITGNMNIFSCNIWPQIKPSPCVSLLTQPD